MDEFGPLDPEPVAMDEEEVASLLKEEKDLKSFLRNPLKNSNLKFNLKFNPNPIPSPNPNPNLNPYP
jgi:hypothetical protein